MAGRQSGLNGSRSSRTSRAPRWLPELSGTVSLGDERLRPTEARVSRSEAAERLLAPYQSAPRNAQPVDCAFRGNGGPEALKAKGDRLRELRIHRHTNLSLDDPQHRRNG
jgi:hypothetical protein